jgi:DNA-binding transcriptional LysR family regulator
VIAVGFGLEYDLDELEVDLLLHGTPRLIVSSEHPFADRSWVNVAELRKEVWIVGEADLGGPQFGIWPTLEGELIVAHSLRDWTARLGLVAAGLGVAVSPSVFVPALPPTYAPSESRTPVPSAAMSSPRPYPGAHRASRRSSALSTPNPPGSASLPRQRPAS